MAALFPFHDCPLSMIDHALVILTLYRPVGIYLPCIYFKLPSEISELYFNLI
jgi:hypothetical protein